MSSIKKVIFFISTLERGGAERVTVYLAEYLTMHGIDVEILTLKKGKNEYVFSDNIKRTVMKTNSRNLPGCVMYLHRYLKDNRPDIVLAMGFPFAMYLVPACIGLKTKLVISERNSPNHFDGKSITKKISQLLFHKADGFVFQTEEARQYYEKKLHGRGTVIFNPLITDNLPPIYTGFRKKQIISVGRLVGQKNHKVLIDAFAKISDSYPDYTLTIYGEGTLRQELTEHIKACNLEERILLPGNKSDVLNRIKDSELFVLSSDFEGMPNALIEAMALGMPCISTDCPCGGPRELIEQSKNGMLVPVGDSDAMSEMMAFMLDHKDEALEMGRSATEIRERLDISVIGEQWLRYLESQI